MMTLLKFGISLLVVFDSVMSSNLYNKIERKEDRCQPITPEGHMRPKVPHQTLSPEFLARFDEIIVIGDLHGCYDEMKLLLNRFDLNSATVLKIFTGDLTRKGPKSLEVVRFVKNCCSCLSVRGNNDEMTLLKVHMKKYIPEFNYISSDQWMANLTQEEVDWLRELPYSLYLPTLNARVVHGGFLPGIPIKNNRPYTMMNIRSVLPAERCPGGWQVTRREPDGERPWASQWHGPEHIYFGHDHRRQLQLYPFATGVDTGCVRGHYLTGVFIKGPRAVTFATQPSLQKYY